MSCVYCGFFSQNLMCFCCGTAPSHGWCCRFCNFAPFQREGGPIFRPVLLSHKGKGSFSIYLLPFRQQMLWAGFSLAFTHWGDGLTNTCTTLLTDGRGGLKAITFFLLPHHPLLFLLCCFFTIQGGHALYFHVRANGINFLFV